MTIHAEMNMREPMKDITLALPVSIGISGGKIVAGAMTEKVSGQDIINLL